jgi:hypothetical protein
MRSRYVSSAGSLWSLSPIISIRAVIPRLASRPGSSVISSVFQRGANLPA